jgi:glyoxylase-like metal-dependent hydrolase (beta-lactamase superfamily II)
VGGGAVAWLSPLYSRRGIDLGGRARALPADGVVPHLPGWRWVHTPGRTPGHVALFRDGDRTLLAGDAFVTTRQESLFAAVRRLAQLSPEVAGRGHGVPMRGGEVRRYVRAPALADESGVRAVPPPVFPRTALLLAVGAGAAVGALTARGRARSGTTS